ncbi:YlmC/YmxH family sporulation protein [Bacillaceae bacterium SIJ1]|uniref:YlmC/YmxH family sporulation protein n=1 Tax=Litoribacterium kuwaitense TaxID=1398745 RepID=UPI0013EDAE13|nr:YlmC/YmxH family sporulation protein [Litoribacterium kuwaitense]NGP44331.1 YlmC/YmxH family sporulation protein [Litoribacterium kuwaitense]
MVKMSSLQAKDVVNVADGKRLGHIGDFEISLSTGKIESIVIPGEGKMLGFKRDSEIVIPWSQIVKIGSDVILIRKSDMLEKATAEEA